MVRDLLNRYRLYGKYSEKILRASIGPLSTLDRQLTRLFSARSPSASAPAQLKNLGYVMFPGMGTKLPALSFEQEVKTNPYLRRRIVSEAQIEALCSYFLSQPELRSHLFSFSDTPYSIDFFFYGVTAHIPREQQLERLYGNTWHTDLPFSHHTVKLFLLLEETSSLDGPFTFLDKLATEKAFALGFDRNSTDYSNALSRHFSKHEIRFTGKRGDVCVGSPVSCLHRASIPVEGHTRKMLALQLNPSPHWSYRKDLYERQHWHEPKLPFFQHLAPKVRVSHLSSET